MKKYIIEVSGRGSECYIHKLTKEQLEELSSIDLESSETDQISKILGIDYVTDTNNSYLGLYDDPKNFIIRVKNQNDDVIWESTNETEFKNTEDEYLYQSPGYLIVDDFVKGSFFSYEIELEEEFKPEKLIPVIKDIGEQLYLITDFIYDGADISFYKNYGDYWSKGLSYYLT